MIVAGLGVMAATVGAAEAGAGRVVGMGAITTGVAGVGTEATFGTMGAAVGGMTGGATVAAATGGVAGVIRGSDGLILGTDVGVGVTSGLRSSVFSTLRLVMASPRTKVTQRVSRMKATGSVQRAKKSLMEGEKESELMGPSMVGPLAMCHPVCHGGIICENPPHGFHRSGRLRVTVPEHPLM